MHRMNEADVELHADACLNLVAASWLRARWPRLSAKLVDLAVEALVLRAQVLAGRAEGPAAVGPPP